jgi:hypothetical protein
LDVARRELVTQTPDGTLQHGAARRAESQVTKSKTQELCVGVAGPVG